MYRITQRGSRELVETQSLTFAKNIAKQHSKKANCEMVVKELRGSRWYTILKYNRGELV